MGGRDCVQEHCVEACTRNSSSSSFHTIQCFHRVMEKFQKQRKFGLYSGNCAKFTVGIMAGAVGLGRLCGVAGGRGTRDDILMAER
jgi:hypothetical protein